MHISVGKFLAVVAGTNTNAMQSERNAIIHAVFHTIKFKVTSMDKVNVIGRFISI